MSITREQIRELAQFQDANSSAVSFYFQPSAPRNKAHKEDAIVVKDLLREALRSENKESKVSAEADLERIQRVAADFRTNGTHGKAVFACADQGFWREYDLPPVLQKTQLFVNRHFHLKPLAHMVGAFPRLGVVLVDRHRARIFDLRLGELTERESLFHALTRKGRSDGFAGYDAGHAERRAEDEARQHFKNVAAALKEFLEKGAFEKWILACQDIHRSQLLPQLHPYVTQSLLGHFNAEVAHISRDEIRSQAQQIVDHWYDERRHELVKQVLNFAHSHGRGVTGLRRVLRSLEMGEVQALMIGENMQAHAVECVYCGHLDAHIVSFCPVCGHATQEIVDVGEAVLPRVIRGDIETFYVKGDAEFDKVGNIAALLRFRGGEVRPIAPSPVDGARGGGEYPGRLRRFASR